MDARLLLEVDVVIFATARVGAEDEPAVLSGGGDERGNVRVIDVKTDLPPTEATADRTTVSDSIRAKLMG
jgi:hypothetical protein